LIALFVLFALSRRRAGGVAPSGASGAQAPGRFFPGESAMSRTVPAALARPALNPAEQWWQEIAASGEHRTLALLQTESAGGRFQRSVYELFAEMEEKDAHFYAAVHTRINGLLGLERTVQPGADSDAGRRAAELVRGAWEALPRREEFLRALLDGLVKGFAVVELLWRYTADGRLVPGEWIAHPQEYFLFDGRGRLLLLSPPFRRGGGVEVPTPMPPAGRGTPPAEAVLEPPARKFVVLGFGRDARNPYGRGLAQRCYWYYWFKKNTLRFWAIYNEKYA
jgi:hypothetical protein